MHTVSTIRHGLSYKNKKIYSYYDYSLESVLCMRCATSIFYLHLYYFKNYLVINLYEKVNQIHIKIY